MKVVSVVIYQGKEYLWNELPEEKKKEFTKKLNKQTADRLGYVAAKQQSECSTMQRASVIPPSVYVFFAKKLVFFTVAGVLCIVEQEKYKEKRKENDCCRRKEDKI